MTEGRSLPSTSVPGGCEPPSFPKRIAMKWQQPGVNLVPPFPIMRTTVAHSRMASTDTEKTATQPHPLNWCMPLFLKSPSRRPCGRMRPGRFEEPFLQDLHLPFVKDAEMSRV